MISCTEFIPSYSELFSFLEEQYGFPEVERYWNDIFNPERNGILNRKIAELGIRGCYEYWAYALNEEAADFTMQLNEADGWFSIEMHHCPSKGRLLALTQIKPYDKYCLHCDMYRKTIEKFGLAYDYDFTRVDHASCAMLVYDPKIYNRKRVRTPETLVMDRRASDNAYRHREFHNYMSMGVEYLGAHFGVDAVKAYLTRFARNYYAPLIARVRAQGLPALRQSIEATYQAEGEADCVSFDEDARTLAVHVSFCPAVAYLKKSGWTPSKWYRYTTETVMDVIAQEAGFAFDMRAYDEETGRAEYAFTSL